MSPSQPAPKRKAPDDPNPLTLAAKRLKKDVSPSLLRLLPTHADSAAPVRTGRRVQQAEMYAFVASLPARSPHPHPHR